jgi:IS30 family transposase
MKKYTRLTLFEREEISRGIWARERFIVIARRLGRPTSSISREVWSRVKYRWCYLAGLAQKQAEEKRRGRRLQKLSRNSRLKDYVYQKLKLKWSPEEIAKRMRLEYPEDKAMRISHETIYQHLYCLPRGELKKELMAGLRQERKLRQPRRYAHLKRQKIQDIISISERPQEAVGRTVPGHWEGDLLIGKNRASALGSLVKRTTRLTLLAPLKDKDAFAVRKAFASSFKKVPGQFKKTLTYDRGLEMSQHKLFIEETKIRVYFADPYSPWQRGTNENTNGLIRQYFPKGTDFLTVPALAIRQAEQMLNGRPRKCLGYYTPAEKFYELITGQKIALGT